MWTHSGTICPSVYGSSVCHQVLRDVTRHFNRPFGNLPGFEHRRVMHQKTFQEYLYHKATLIFGESSPLNAFQNEFSHALTALCMHAVCMHWLRSACMLYVCTTFHITVVSVDVYKSWCPLSRNIGDFENSLFLVCENFSLANYNWFTIV